MNILGQPRRSKHPGPNESLHGRQVRLNHGWHIRSALRALIVQNHQSAQLSAVGHFLTAADAVKRHVGFPTDHCHLRRRRTLIGHMEQLNLVGKRELLT
ncbi:hypothetical protein D3C86_1853390 [compost metagenome]